MDSLRGVRKDVRSAVIEWHKRESPPSWLNTQLFVRSTDLRFEIMARLEMTSGVLVQGVYLKGGGAESLLDLMTWDKFDYQLFHILVDENKDESDEEFTYIAAAEDKPTADELVDQWANLSKILTTDEDKRDKNFYTVMNLIAKARYVLSECHNG